MCGYRVVPNLKPPGQYLGLSNLKYTPPPIEPLDVAPAHL